MQASLNPLPFEALPGWSSDDPTPVIKGFADCSRHVEAVRPYRTVSLGVMTREFAAAFAAASDRGTGDARGTRRFFEEHFQACRIDPRDGDCGFVTAYYEPELKVSTVHNDHFRHPIYGRLGDLVALDDGNRPAGMDRSYAFGRQTSAGIDFHPDRRAIDEGVLEGRRLEIAWAACKVDVFFMHVQGAGRLRFADVSTRRVTYAAKASHPFTVICKVLIEWGELAADVVTMDTTRDWLADNPDRADSLLWLNRSYIFFREASVDDPRRGPVAAAKVPLRAGRSLAVYRLIHTFATPFYIQADTLTHLGDGPFQRLMMAQDKGTAIVGPARGDLFVGSGDAAGAEAGSVKHDAVFFALLPKPVARRLMP